MAGQQSPHLVWVPCQNDGSPLSHTFCCYLIRTSESPSVLNNCFLQNFTFEEKLQFRHGGREKTQGKEFWRIGGIYQKISLVDSREDDANSLKNFSRSLVFFNVISVANSAAKMLFVSSFDMPPLVCKPSILVSFLLCPQGAPVSPILIFS